MPQPGNAPGSHVVGPAALVCAGLVNFLAGIAVFTEPDAESQRGPAPIGLCGRLGASSIKSSAPATSKFSNRLENVPPEPGRGNPQDGEDSGDVTRIGAHCAGDFPDVPEI